VKKLSAIGAVVTVVAVELVADREGLIATFGLEDLLNLGDGKEGPFVIGAVTVGTSLIAVALHVVSVTIHPTLPHQVHSMRSAIWGGREGAGMAHRAFCNARAYFCSAIGCTLSLA
jgi:hypothetical protein